MLEPIIKPKPPIGPGWREIKSEAPELSKMGYPYSIWAHDENQLGVISAVEVATTPGEPDLGPEYHISISNFGQRCSTADALWVLGQFDLIDAKEDNHVPSGKVRNFWRPVADNLSGYECPCQKTEPTIKEDKGDFIWRGFPNA